MIKAHAVRLLAVALALAGFAAAVYFAAALLWPQTIGALVPALNVGSTPFLGAALGAVMMTVGALLAARLTAFIRAEERRREDRLRRVRVYQSDQAAQQAYDSRLEPFIGPGTVTDRQADRRVA